MFIRLIYIYTLCLSGISFTYSQQDNIWYFGLNSGLDFNTTPPTILTNGLSTNFDNSSTMCDASGNLLFYSTGMNVWDKNHTLMPNGAGLIGNTTGGQCALIVPKPCDPNKYIIFHTTEFSNPGSIHYTVVDMTLNGGLGDVVLGQKNISLGTGWTEKLCAYFNPAGNFYWVVSHKWQSDQYVAFKVDQSSIGTTSVITSIGSVHNCGTVGGAHDAMGQLTISPDGTKLINALTCSDKFELFDFNITTGGLSNLITIPGDGNKAWGTAFSPDSKKIYVNSIFGKSIYQYDINVYVQPTIVSSQFVLVTMPANGYNFGYMELGPDNKLYITRPNTNWLSVVGIPNNLGGASGFVLNGQSVGAMQSRWGLSRIAYNIQPSSSSLTLTPSVTDVTCFGQSNGSATITPSATSALSYTWLPSVSTTSIASNLSPGLYSIFVSDGSCLTASTTVSIVQPNKVNASCNINLSSCKGILNTNNLTQSATSYTWNFGNGIYSSIGSPSYTYTQPGSYTVTLIASNANNCLDSIKQVVNVYEPTQSAFSQTTTVCDSTLWLNNNSTGAINYLWDFGDGITSTAPNPSTHVYSQPGAYVVTLVTNPNGVCPDTSKVSVFINYNSIADFSFTVNNCNRSVKLYNTSTNAFNAFWDFGNGDFSVYSTPIYSYNLPGTYTISLIVNKNTGCADTVLKQVSFGEVYKADYTYKVDPCNGIVAFSNTSINSSTFYWNFGDANGAAYTKEAIYKYTQSGDYQVLLIANPGLPCADSMIKLVKVDIEKVTADFSFKEPEYDYNIQFTNKSDKASVFLWDFNDGSSTTVENPSHLFQSFENIYVCLSARNEHGCGDTICKEVTFKPNWTLYVPNCFTPDESGLNDIFYAYGTNIKSFDMIIFDRWGEELFRSQDMSVGWNGFYKGKIAKDDEYIWKIEFKDYYNKLHHLTGHVLLKK
jgi:gliding motility-associated-like protein